MWGGGGRPMRSEKFWPTLTRGCTELVMSCSAHSEKSVAW